MNITELNIFESAEKPFDNREYVDDLLKWTGDNWIWTVYLSACYVVTIFSLKYYMENKEKFELRGLLAVWNIFLATFSIIGSYKVLPDFINTIRYKGFDSTICEKDFLYGSSGFWAYLFVISKGLEFADTLFIVLRKQQLIFLHWYHHATVLIYCVYSYHEFSASGRWYMTMNYFVHSIMYTYYALRALKVRITPAIAQVITILQLIQMILGCYLNYYSYRLLPLSGKYSSCHISMENIKYSSILYFSYFVLFANFFINSYINKKHSSYRQVNGHAKSDSNSIKSNGIKEKAN